MLSFIRRTFPGLWRDERGTSVLELAIAAPIFGMMVVGVVDIGRGFSERYALQQAANRTLEMAHLGSTRDNYDYLKAEAAAAAGVPETDVVLESWLECDGGSKQPWTATCADGAQIARYLTLTINSSFRPSFGTGGYVGARSDGTVPLRAEVSLRVQ